jgi:hypothetical protein
MFSFFKNFVCAEKTSVEKLYPQDQPYLPAHNFTLCDADLLKLKNILNRIQIYIEAEVVSHNPQDYSQTRIVSIYEDNTDRVTQLFISDVNAAISFLQTRKSEVDSKAKQFFNLTMAMNFESWDSQSLKDLSVFFSVFQNINLRIKIEAKELEHSSIEKLNIFIAAIKTANVHSLFVSNPVNGENTILSDDRMALMHQQLPLTNIIPSIHGSHKVSSLVELKSSRPLEEKYPDDFIARETYFNVLGLPLYLAERNFEAVLNANFRKLSLTHHPDNLTGNPEQFQKIKEAYNYLLQPENREPITKKYAFKPW